jgi:GNAT superfamily N-acetyltransferase
MQNAAAAHVEIGTSALAHDTEFVAKLSRMVNAAYGRHRLGVTEARHRLLSCGNRVLHVATRDGQLVGCCSSTLHTPWCEPTCGHWGLLVVDEAAHGSGVATALVAAAEQRLANAGLRAVQIEYHYNRGDPLSERLLAWYEGSLGFTGPSSRASGFRIARKKLPARSAGGPAPAGLACVRWMCAILRWLCCCLY